MTEVNNLVVSISVCVWTTVFACGGRVSITDSDVTTLGAVGGRGTGTNGSPLDDVATKTPLDGLDANCDVTDAGGLAHTRFCICRTSNGQCATVTVLLCATDHGQVLETCLSSDSTQCSGASLTVSVGSWVCQDQCGQSEYGVSWSPSAYGGSSVAECREITVDPDGTGLFCCPCSGGDR
jgi:hypothetical protein